uniref:Uncharacterized protein n=1 Tax=Arundo donax TaxID=35708 RepID=A0A0A9CF17_ARUDO
MTHPHEITYSGAFLWRPPAVIFRRTTRWYGPNVRNDATHPRAAVLAGVRHSVSVRSKAHGGPKF